MCLEALRQLTLARFREFIREPEAVFWTFVFPLLLAGGLAIAFRDKKQEQAIIAMSHRQPAIPRRCTSAPHSHTPLPATARRFVRVRFRPTASMKCCAPVRPHSSSCR